MVKCHRARRASTPIPAIEVADKRSPANDSRPPAELSIVYMSPDDLKESPRNARTHPGKQVRQMVASIKEHGFVNPVLADENNVLIAGHGRLTAARKLELTSIPVVTLHGLSDIQKRKLSIADNAIAANSGWDLEKLAIEFQDFIKLDDFEPISIGFESADIDRILFECESRSADPADVFPEPAAIEVSKRGDLWQLGGHRMLCGDARNAGDFARVMSGDLAAGAFLDLPYNVRIKPIVGRGERKHEEFAMASGEMTEAEFADFIKKTLSNAIEVSRPGAVHFNCMDWRSVSTLIEVGRTIYGDMLNLVTWVKSNAGQGSFYRSQHELIGVFRVGTASHLNNIELGKHGRNRSNVWHYAGVNSFGKGRLDDLTVHPTVKPVNMIVEAIKDCTKRGDIVLDCFAGSGTTMLAAERTGRKARSIEFEPHYVDVSIRRWQDFTRKDAIHVETGATFDEMAAVAEKEGV